MLSLTQPGELTGAPWSGAPTCLRRILVRGFVSSIVGSVLGIMLSMILNVSLVEITISRFFSLYFGVLFIFTGCVISWRILGHPALPPECQSRQRLFLVLSSLVTVSGFVCLLIGGGAGGWFYHSPRLVKVLVYSLLGVAVSFALIFSTIDLINVGFGLCVLMNYRSPVESNVQVMLIVAVALVMGCVFGFIYGLLDVSNNEIAYHVKLSLLKQESFTYPIGGLLGALTGFANEYLRDREDAYITVKRQEYDADI